MSIDVDDVLSSAIRRIDLAFLRGRVRASSEREFWAFAAVVADRVRLNRLLRLRRERAFVAR